MNDTHNTRVVVFDTDVPYEQNNQFFNRERVADNRFLWPWSYLYEECRKRNITLLTSDLYLKLPKKPKRALLVAVHMRSRNTERLIKMGLHPSIIFGYENPLFACHFYMNLGRMTKAFDHAVVWNAFKDMLGPRTQFHDAAYHPHAYSSHELGGPFPPFEEKKYMVMINRNNRIHVLRKLYTAVATHLHPVKGLQNRELYLDRLQAIQFFSQRPDFDLYGGGWDKPIRYDDARFRKAIQNSYRGYVADKHSTLRQYKFSLCFENAICNGFVTEKIIDSLAAGCVPVYLGAPDIAAYIPPETFINAKDFKSYAALHAYLTTMDHARYQRYSEAIRAFTQSEAYRPFTQEDFARTMIALFESSF